MNIDQNVLKEIQDKISSKQVRRFSIIHFVFRFEAFVYYMKVKTEEK